MRYVRAAAEDDVQPGSALRVELEGRTVALVRSVDGRLFAVSDSCSHEDASLAEGFVDGRGIECPRHGATFDLETGKALSLPAIEAIATFKVRVENGGIFVNIT